MSQFNAFELPTLNCLGQQESVSITVGEGPERPGEQRARRELQEEVLLFDVGCSFTPRFTKAGLREADAAIVLADHNSDVTGR